MQAQQAIYFGETPVNTKACPFMNKLSQGLVRAVPRRTRRSSYFKTIKFWKTPIADCGNGKKDCMDYTQVAAGLDGDQGLVAWRHARHEAGRPSGRPAAGSRRASGAGRGCGRCAARCCRSPGSLLVYLASLVVAVRLGVLDGRPVHAARSSTPGRLDNFRHDLRRARPTGGSRCRTIGIAAAVTVTDAVLAFPFAYFMARVASPRLRTLLFVLVLLPLWSSYLVAVYAWRLILANDGVLNWCARASSACRTPNIAYTNTAMWIVFSYIWLPFMILPVYAALERIPHSLHRGLARPRRARLARRSARVILPLALPGVVAGSIFTFSLTLGDYITPTLVGGANSQFIGNVVYDNVGGCEQLPVRGGVRDGAARRHGASTWSWRAALGAFEAL